MDSLQDKMKRIKSEELIQRFRSKQDIYKYLTEQMGLYLPSFKGTKLIFLRAILGNKKKALKQVNVNRMVIPHFDELSVKNIYPDAILDNQLREYLPDLEQNSNRIPERDFFFGILGTLKTDYLRKIISDANRIRFEADENDPQKDFIMLGDEWYQELIKHPFISKKPGRAIYLIKERSKLIRAPRKEKKHSISQRLSGRRQGEEERKSQEESGSQQRRHLLDTTMIVSEPSTSSSQKKK